MAGVRTDRGTIGCETLVIAAGPQIGPLAASLGVRVPMVAARAEMIVTEPLPLMPIGGVDGNGLYGARRCVAILPMAVARTSGWTTR